MVDAAAVRAGFESASQRIRAVIERHRVSRPTPRITFDIHPRRVVWTLFLDRAAISATRWDVCADLLRAKVSERPEGGQPDGPAAKHPYQQIQIMTAFGEDHWTAPPRICPVTANEAVREMPIDEVLVPLERDDVAKPAADH